MQGILNNFTFLTANADANPMSAILSMVIPFALLFVVMYFLMIRPQRKKEKETHAMRNNILVGDEVVTVGGIVGIVISIREDTIIIETGTDRHKVRVKRWAIQQNETKHDDTV